MQRPTIIGIAGGSGSGKSTVLQCIIEAFGLDAIAILEHDAYYYDLSDQSFEKRATFNFDHPCALETRLMREHLDQLLDGQSIEKPIYDFNTHTRVHLTQRVPTKPVIIIEGILVLAEPLLREQMDIKFFVDTADDIRLMRRIRRDMTERNRTIESILEQYERTVRPMYLEFVEPSKHLADLIIPHGGHNRVGIDIVLAHIETLLSNTQPIAKPIEITHAPS